MLQASIWGVGGVLGALPESPACSEGGGQRTHWEEWRSVFPRPVREKSGWPPGGALSCSERGQGSPGFWLGGARFGHHPPGQGPRAKQRKNRQQAPLLPQPEPQGLEEHAGPALGPAGPGQAGSGTRRGFWAGEIPAFRESPGPRATRADKLGERGTAFGKAACAAGKRRESSFCSNCGFTRAAFTVSSPETAGAQVQPQGYQPAALQIPGCLLSHWLFPRPEARPVHVSPACAGCGQPCPKLPPVNQGFGPSPPASADVSEPSLHPFQHPQLPPEMGLLIMLWG